MKAGHQVRHLRAPRVHHLHRGHRIVSVWHGTDPRICRHSHDRNYHDPLYRHYRHTSLSGMVSVWVEEGKIEEISEQLFARYLDTGHLPDPDFLIRTSGEMRISNFLLWQIAYTEVYITERLWPDFTPQDLYDALFEFQKRERRIGQ